MELWSEPPYCFPQWLHQFIFSPTVHKSSLLSTLLSTFFIVFLIIAIFIGMTYHLTVVLIYISLMISDFEHFSCTYWSYVCLLWKNVYSGPFFNWVVSLLLNCTNSLYIWDIKILSDIICKNALQFSRLPFHFVNSSSLYFKWVF